MANFLALRRVKKLPGAQLPTGSFIRLSTAQSKVKLSAEVSTYYRNLPLRKKKHDSQFPVVESLMKRLPLEGPGC